MNRTILLTAIIVITTSLITGSLIFVPIPEGSARKVIDDPTLQYSPAAQSNAKPCKNCPSFQVVQRSGPAIQIPPEGDKTATALCQSGEIATGGGYTEDGPMLVFESKALSDNTGWSITFHNGGFGQPTLSGSAYAECAIMVP